MALRRDDERAMEQAAKQLPVHAWIKSMPGAGAIGPATIIAEAGDLSNYC
jgi:hypothetical protein